jgi:hypothetical protein
MHAYAWEGSPDAVIHGPNWYIDLPQLDFEDAVVTTHALPAVYVEVFVEGHSLSGFYRFSWQIVNTWPLQMPAPEKVKSTAEDGKSAAQG